MLSLLSRRGWVSHSLVPERVPLSELIALLRTASLLITIHGAGMINQACSDGLGIGVGSLIVLEVRYGLRPAYSMELMVGRGWDRIPPPICTPPDLIRCAVRTQIFLPLRRAAVVEAFLPHMIYTTGPQLSNICGFLHLPIFLRWTDASPAPLVHSESYMGNFGKWGGWDVDRMRNYTVHCAKRCSAHLYRMLALQQSYMNRRTHTMAHA